MSGGDRDDGSDRASSDLITSHHVHLGCTEHSYSLGQQLVGSTLYRLAGRLECRCRTDRSTLQIDR